MLSEIFPEINKFCLNGTVILQIKNLGGHKTYVWNDYKISQDVTSISKGYHENLQDLICQVSLLDHLNQHYFEERVDTLQEDALKRNLPEQTTHGAKRGTNLLIKHKMCFYSTQLVIFKLKLTSFIKGLHFTISYLQ